MKEFALFSPLYLIITVLDLILDLFSSLWLFFVMALIGTYIFTYCKALFLRTSCEDIFQARIEVCSSRQT